MKEEIIGQILKHIFEGDDEDDRMKIEVGILDDELLDKMKVMKKEKRRIKDEIEVRMKELELRFQREADEILDPLKEKSNKAHDDFWKAVYYRNDLDPKYDYNVDPEARKVYQYVDNDGPSFGRH
jgi:hypothetical protein